MESMNFVSPTHGPLALDQVLVQISQYIQSSDRHQHKMIIGTDSAAPLGHGHEAEFVTALVVHRVGNGGIYFWRRARSENLHTLRDRMYREATYSLELARLLITHPQFPLTSSPDVFEIHIDIGENGPTRQMIREITGMVVGSGFRVQTKPASYAASKVADRYT